MNNLFNFKSIQLYNLYNNLLFHKYKDKLDMILEPLQSMIQLAILSVKPIGTKLAIQENILYIQQPSIIQPINRWYNSDKKDDLYFLFQVIKRFIKWYNPENKIISSELYDLICSMSLIGLDNLVKTYNNTDNNSIIQVLHLYKNLLEVPNSKELDKHLNDKVNIDEVFENIIILYKPNKSHTTNESKIKNKLKGKSSKANTDDIHPTIIAEGISPIIDNKYSPSEKLTDLFDDDCNQVNIDNLSTLEQSNTPLLLNIIYSILMLINNEENPEYISSYIKSLNYVMEKTNTEIQNWIKVNLNV
jgi:hypothetical protein